MKVAITGAAGLFGQGLTQVLGESHTVCPLAHAEMDITNARQVESVLQKLRPDVVIHAAAIPDLDICEADPARAYLVNVHGARYVLEAARRTGARVAYISTDAVFDGCAQNPYREHDATRPLTVYGRTKLRAERLTLNEPESWAFRVSVLFGPGKTNFVEKGLRKIAGGETYTVAADQYGCATYTIDAAKVIAEAIDSGRYGLYHVTNAGECSRLELAQSAARLAGLDPSNVIGKPAAEMGRRAPRLKYAVVEMEALERAGFTLPRPWTEALAEYVATLGAPQPLSLMA
ncbi:MAG: SDR family oxidoreductase [Terriglobia bacterium]